MNKKFIKAALIAATIIATVNFSTEADAAKKLKLNTTNKTITVGKSFKLKVKNVKAKKVTFKTSNKKVATVSKTGKVTAKKAGNAKITAKVKKQKAVCKVKVVKKATPVPAPTSAPVVDKLAEAPKFIGFKNYEGEKLEQNKAITFSSMSFKTFDANDVASPAALDVTVNKNEVVFLKLSYENKKRDSIVEIVLNDSDYGKNQIYTANASKNKIISVDTEYNEAKDLYVTDVLIKLPGTISKQRTVEVVETCFLRETVGLKGYADMNASVNTTVINLQVPELPVETSTIFFNYIEKNGKYYISSLVDEYINDIPDTVYIPREYNGKQIAGIEWEGMAGLPSSTLIVPETLETVGSCVTGTGSDCVKTAIFLGNSITQIQPMFFTGAVVEVPDTYVYNDFNLDNDIFDKTWKKIHYTDNVWEGLNY